MWLDYSSYVFTAAGIQTKIDNITDDAIVIDDSQGVSCYMETDVKHSEILEDINEIMGLFKELINKDMSELNQVVSSLEESNNASNVGS